MIKLKKEIEKAAQPYQKRKHILDIAKLEKNYRINRKFFLLFFIGLIFFLMNKRYFLFAAATILSAVFSFYHSKFNRTPMDFKFALFLGIFITRYYGIGYTFIFFIISDIVPGLLGGESVNGSDLFFMAWYFIVNSLVYLFPHAPLELLGPALVVIEAIGSFFINSFFGIPGLVSFLVSFLTIMVRIIYFLTLGRVLEALFKAII